MNKKSTVVSVITVTHNIIESGEKNFLIKCLQSVHSQTYQDIEHIVIDGASTDGTQELLEEYAKKGWIRYISEPDNGMYEAMNKGTMIATGTYVTYLNTDDLYNSPNTVSVFVKALETSGAVFSYAPVKVINTDGTQPKSVHYHENPNVSETFVHMPFSHQSMFFKREMLVKEGLYDTQFKYAGDYDLTIRLCLKEYKCVLVDEKLVTYRNGGRTDKNEVASSEEVYKIFYKNFSTIVDISQNECKSIYGSDITKIPYKLAYKLRKLKPYFNFSKYNRLSHEKLETQNSVLERIKKHPVAKVSNLLIELSKKTVGRISNIRFFKRKTVDMMELWHNQHIDTALSHVHAPVNELKCLVIGCNRGEECEILYNKGVRDISGIDLIDDLGNKFQHKSVKYYHGFAENMYLFEDNTYDLVYSFATFEHVHDIKNAYKEAARITKPGGIVYIFASPLWDSPYGHHYDNIYKGYPWIHLRFDETEMLDFCAKNGIDTTAGNINYMLKSGEFNRRKSGEYTEACNDVLNVEIISNQLAQVDATMEKEIDKTILDKGYKLDDLLSIWHLFIARKK